MLLAVILASATSVYVFFISPKAVNPPLAQVFPPKVTAQKQTMNIAVYYVKFTENDAYLVREVHQVPFSEDSPGAAVKELISANPQTAGAYRVLPPGTRLLGIIVKEGLATVNFSADVLNANVGSTGEALGIQSIVNTLTEFPEIREVSFQVEGGLDSRAQDWWGHMGLFQQPFKRNLDMVNEPAIWVTHPVPGQAAGVPLLVKGSARVFEGAVSARLIDPSGKILAKESAVASRGAPGRGDFEMKLTYAPPGKGSGVLEVYWTSPRDGSQLDTVKIAIQWP